MAHRKKSEQQLHDEIEFLLQQRRDGHILSTKDLLKLIDMAFKDYMDFNPDDEEETYE